jgi:hypothetical protein
MIAHIRGNSLYQTLTTASSLYKWHNSDSGTSSSLIKQANALKDAINTNLYDDSHGAFRDNFTRTILYPQDANSMAILFNATYPNRTTSISDRLREEWTDIGPISPELPDNISPFITSFELQGHFTLRKTNRALNLLRRTWGWYINNPNGTESTLIEGYRADGSFGYRAERGYMREPSYVSHAHGWSAGPTSALTNFVAGLSPTDLLGSKWKIAPQLGDLSYAEAGFTTSLGKFRVAWQRVDARPNSTTFRDFAGYDVQIETPLGTEGEVVLPFLEENVEPSVSTFETSGAGNGPHWKSDGWTWKASVDGGKKQFTVRQVFEGSTGQDAPPAVDAKRPLWKEQIRIGAWPEVGWERIAIRDWGW